MSLAQILVERLFIPASMASASLCPNTNGLPLPIVGYEGNATVGYFAATNRIEWAGACGHAASGVANIRLQPPTRVGGRGRPPRFA
jgi:hypothetical protein